jgi:integrase
LSIGRAGRGRRSVGHAAGRIEALELHLPDEVALGRLKVREIHRGHIKVFLAEKRAKGYAKNTVRLMRVTLSALLSDAVDDGIIMANPAFGLGRRKASRADRLTPAERIQKVRPMNWEQRDAFPGAVKNPRYSTRFELLAKAGLRPGEAFALQPGDIDWRNRVIRVERAWNLQRIEPTKTYEERTVDLSPDLLHSLERHVIWVKSEALRCGWGEPEWLFPNDEGKPHDESRVRKFHKKGLKDAKLPSFRLYDLRHTYASLLLAAGAPITYVSAQLGHSNPSTTLKYYARWIPSRGQRWVDLLDRATARWREPSRLRPRRFRVQSGTRFGTKSARNSKSGTPVIPKCPIRLVGRQGLEPWTR